MAQSGDRRRLPTPADSCTNEEHTLPLDAELQAVVELWPRLVPAARAAVAAMVKATVK